MTSSNSATMLEALAEVQLQRKALEKEEKKLREALAEFLSTQMESGNGNFVSGEYMFEQKLMPGRKTLDKELVAEAGIDLDPYMKQGKPFTTLSIKRVNTI